MIALFQNRQWMQSQPFWFTLLRIAIGWHFLWEGWIKLASPNWSAKGYLMGSWGPFAPVLKWMAELPWILGVINLAMPWMLFIAGLGILLGAFTRASMVLAMALLAVFIIPTPGVPYLTLNPPGAELQWSSIYLDLNSAQWAGKHMTGMEGSYFLVTKNVIELLTLAAMLTFDRSKLYGLDLWLAKPNETIG